MSITRQWQSIGQYCTHSDLQSGWPPKRDGWGLSGPNSTIQDYHARRYALLTLPSSFSKLQGLQEHFKLQGKASLMIPGGLGVVYRNFWSTCGEEIRGKMEEIEQK
ncbi:hypothetical protein E3N88_04678 [Mikania micrantha]|uniref:Uncharacterized protein n=1 Tax=Mikania micrantha TaxID=192012 RepID=A0A5N6PXV6_9ASTR|nr:hypothetical protein E3N88_04678 [Mikania micrantha]